MSKSDLKRIFPFKIFLIALTMCAPAIVFVVMVAFGIGGGQEGRADWNDSFSRENMIAASIITIIYVLALTVGWLAYKNKRNKLLNK